MLQSEVPHKPLQSHSATVGHIVLNFQYLHCLYDGVWAGVDTGTTWRSTDVQTQILQLWHIIKYFRPALATLTTIIRCFRRFYKLMSQVQQKYKTGASFESVLL